MRTAALALMLLSAFVVLPAFATLGAEAACPNPTVGLEDCPPGSRLPVYPRVCYAEITELCDGLP